MKSLVAVVVIFSFLFENAFGQEIPVRPDTIHNMYDFAGLLSNQQRIELEERITLFEDSSKVNIMVVTVPTIRGYNSADFAKSLAKNWEINTSRNDRSILLFFAEQQRIFEMVPGKNVKQIFTEVAEKKIQKEFIEDNFRKGSFYEGINKVVFVVGGLSTGRLIEEDIFKEGTSKIYFVIIPLFLFFLLVFPILQYRILSKSRIGSKPLSFFTALSLMNAFGGTGRAGYQDFMNGKGAFRGEKSGGGGAAGAW